MWYVEVQTEENMDGDIEKGPPLSCYGISSKTVLVPLSDLQQGLR